MGASETAADDLTLHGHKPRFAAGFQSVGDRTWAWMQPNGELGESNAGLIVSGDHALMVDTLWDLKLTGRMLEAAGDLIDFDPQIIFNTHSDGDHVWGNQLLPDAEIISTTKAKELMPLDTPKAMAAMRRGGRVLEALGSLPVPVIGSLDIKALPRLPLRELGREFKPFDFAPVDLTLPSRTFDGSLKLAIGDRQVELIEVGPAHTGGDAIAWVPDVSVCFAADVLFVGCTPIMWAGPVSNWITALDTLIGLGASTFVPGHGPICGIDEVRLVRDYFEWVQVEGVSRLGDGESGPAIARRLLLSDEFVTLPWAKWDDPARLVVTLASEDHNRAGATLPLGGAARSRVVMKMARTKADLARRAIG
ncbi:MAG: MBL fold metallo-hydrolase [Solirubrobacterales bacterium]